MTASALLGTTAILSSVRSPSVTFTGYIPILGDYVYFLVQCQTVSAITTPAGWINPVGGNTAVASDSHEAIVVYRPVTSGEVSGGTTSYSATNLFGGNVSGHVCGCVLRDTSGIDDVGTGFDSGDTTTPHVIAGLVGANLSTESLVLGGITGDGQATYTDPSGWTLVVKNSSGQGSCALYTRNTLTTAGVDVAPQNITPSVGDEYASVTIAFLPLLSAQASNLFFTMF